MKSIGGYFELELNEGAEYHKDAIKVNSGRSAFKYILISQNVRKIYLPLYTCEAIYNVVKDLKISYEVYGIDENLIPIFDFSKLKREDYFLYTNYFGLMDSLVKKLSKITRQLIIDNSQSFYSKPIKGLSTFYSPRKFFGVPDGGYVYIESPSKLEIQQDTSFKRCAHLLKRIDLDSENGYHDFLKAEIIISKQPLLKMSKLTNFILKSIDYQKVARKRKENFRFLNDSLRKKNQFTIIWNNTQIPLVYPLLIENNNKVKEELHKNKIYIPTYWPNINNSNNRNSIEHYYAQNLLFLPIDQRISKFDLNLILKLIN